MEKGEFISTEGLFIKYLRSSVEATSAYVKKVLLPGAQIISKYNLADKQIGDLQRKVAEGIVEGSIIDEDFIANAVFDIKSAS